MARSVTLVNGGTPGPWPAAAGVQLVQLPPVAARDVGLRRPRRRVGDAVTAALWESGGALLLNLLELERPQVIVTEMFPFGRRALPRRAAAAAGGSASAARRGRW